VAAEVLEARADLAGVLGGPADRAALLPTVVVLADPVDLMGAPVVLLRAAADLQGPVVLTAGQAGQADLEAPAVPVDHADGVADLRRLR
jgi:hypothetical protein